MFLCCFAQQSCNFCLQENATILLLSYILRQGNMQTAYLSSWCLKTEVGSCFFALLLFSDNMLTTMCKLKLSNNLPDFCIFKSIFARINLKYRKNSSFLPFLVSLFRVLFWWRSPFPILKTKTTCSQPEAFSIGNLYFLCTTSSSWLQGFFLFGTEGIEGQLKKKTSCMIITYWWGKWDLRSANKNRLENNHHPGWTKMEVRMKKELRIPTPLDGSKQKLNWKLKIDLKILTIQDGSKQKLNWILKLDLKILTTQDGEPAVCEHPPTQTRPAAEVDWGDFLYQNFSIVFCFVSVN